MTTDSEIFQKHSQILKQAVLILENRISQIEEKAKDAKYSSLAYEERENVISIFKIRSLRFYKDTLFYISETLNNDSFQGYVFVLPNIRTLIDIYGKFIHLLEKCSDEDQQAMVCFALQLLVSKSLDSEVEYQKMLGICSNFLAKKNYVFPSNVNMYGRKWVKNNKLSFDTMDKILTPQNMKKYSRDVFNIFGTDKHYAIFSYFSELVHGNPYCYTGKDQNEKFWVVSMSMSITAFLIEIVDNYTLKKVNPKDFRTWINEVKNNKKDLLDPWIKKVKK